MNKESLTAIVIGLLIGAFIFLVVKKTEKLFFWRQASPEQTLEESSITPPAQTPFEIDTQETQPDDLSAVEVLFPQPFFLAKDKQLEFKFKTASGSGLIIRVNDQAKFNLVESDVWQRDLKLEAGANLIEFYPVELSDNLQLRQPVAINGVVSSKKYPAKAQAGSGTLLQVNQDEVVIKADSGQEIKLLIKPKTSLYAFDDNGRLVSLTKLDDKFLNKRAIFIFQKEGGDLVLIKLQIIKNWQVAKSQTFIGKVSKLDDDKRLYQIVNVDNEVIEINLSNKIGLFNSQGQKITSDEISLGDRVLVFSLANKPSLVVVAPQTNLLEK